MGSMLFCVGIIRQDSHDWQDDIESCNFLVGVGGFFFGIMEMALRNPFGLPLKKKNCLRPGMLITRGEFFSFRQDNKDFSHFRAALIFWFFWLNSPPPEAVALSFPAEREKLKEGMYVPNSLGSSPTWVGWRSIKTKEQKPNNREIKRILILSTYNQNFDHYPLDLAESHFSYN